MFPRIFNEGSNKINHRRISFSNIAIYGSVDILNTGDVGNIVMLVADEMDDKIAAAGAGAAVGAACTTLVRDALFSN